MRGEASREKVRRLISELGKAAKGPGVIYLVGGSSVVLEGLRASTIDVDLKLDPEPAGIFEAISKLKNELDVNIELAAPDQFIPELPGWRERSPLIEQIGEVEFRHYDFFSQALAKLERAHARDLQDVRELLSSGLIVAEKLMAFYEEIEPALIRFPSIDPIEFRKQVQAVFTDENSI